MEKLSHVEQPSLIQRIGERLLALNEIMDNALDVFEDEI